MRDHVANVCVEAKLLEKTKRKNEEEEAGARKKVQMEFEETVSAAGPDAGAQHTQGRLQAALWASKQEWADQIPAGAPKVEPAVQEVEFKGQRFLWPKITSPPPE